MTVFIIHIHSMTYESTGDPTRPVRFILPCRMTAHPELMSFTGTMIECLNEITRLCPGVEYFERCTGETIVLMPTGEVNKYIEDKECPLFCVENTLI